MREVQVMRLPGDDRVPGYPEPPPPPPPPVPGAPDTLPIMLPSRSGGAGGTGGLVYRFDDGGQLTGAEQAMTTAAGAGVERGLFLIVAAVLGFMVLKARG